MIQKIVNGYGKLLVSLLKILALVALCAVFALLFVLPLWKFASVAPDVYSLVVLLLLACGIVFWIAQTVSSYLAVDDENSKKRRRSRLLVGAGKILVILAGLGGIVVCILSELAIAAWIVLVLTVVLYGVLAFGTKKDKKL